MKPRNRIISAGVGMAMLAASMFAFSGTAQAASGDLAILGGSITFPSTSGTITSGFSGGTITGSTWTSNIPTTMTGTALPGLPGCFDITVTVAAGNDVISWDAANTGTQQITNPTITIDSRGCGAPPNGVCNLTLNSTKTFATTTGGFAPNMGFRTGTFVHGPANAGNITISDAGFGNCLSSGLAAAIATAFNTPAGVCTAPASLPKVCNGSTAQVSVSLVKRLEL